MNHKPFEESEGNSKAKIYYFLKACGLQIILLFILGYRDVTFSLKVKVLIVSNNILF